MGFFYFIRALFICSQIPETGLPQVASSYPQGWPYRGSFCLKNEVHQITFPELSQETKQLVVQTFRKVLCLVYS